MGPNALKFFHSLARKGLTKNRGSGITEIADRMAVESEAASMIQTIVDSGLPLERFDQFIRSEADVLKFLNIIKNAKPVSTSETTSGVVLPFKQKRSFAEEIELMKKSGDIVDPNNLKKNDNVLTREMFRDSNLNKPTIEGQMDKINAASNRIKQIQKEQADMYRPKTDAEIKAKYDKQNEESIKRFKDKMKKDEPEDKADGGRIGFRGGKFVFDKIVAKVIGDKKKVQQAVDDIFPTGDYKYDAEMAADALVELNPKDFKNLLREDLPEKLSSEIYGAVLKPIMSNMAKMRELRKATKPEKTLQSMKEGKGIDMSNPDIADEFGRFMKETDPEGYKKLEQTVELANFDPKKVKGNAEGGRIGYQEGGGIESRLEQLGGDVTSAEQLLQQINERLQSAESSVPEGDGQLTQLPAGGLGTLATLAGSNQPFMGRPIMQPLLNQPLGQPLPATLESAQPGPNSFGIINSLTDKRGPAFDTMENAYKNAVDSSAEMKRVGRLDQLDVLGGQLNFEDYKKNFSMDDKGFVTRNPIQTASSQENLQKALPGLFAKGGRAGFYTGGITDVEPSLNDIGHGADAMMSRTRLMSPGSQATTSTGLNYLLAEDNDNLRVPFSDAGFVDEALAHYNKYLNMRKARPPKKRYKEIPFTKFFEEFSKENKAEGGRIGFSGGGDPRRRAFLKLMAALTGGVAAVKSGIIGLGEGTTKKAVTETIKQSAGSGQPPPYFFKLVDKIKTMGDDVTKKSASQEREVVTKYKDFELTENIATGEKTIQRIKIDDGNPQYYDETLAEETYMNYKPGKGQADEATPRVADEYTEDTSYLRTSGPQKGEIFDTVDGVPKDVVQEGTVFEDNMTEFGMTKKADGGRIGYNIGGLSKLGITGSSRRFLEKVFGKEKFARMIENDPELHRGMLEVVEMFRNKDKEGLKMYMQKFLPHMDDEMVEDFIVGSGGTEGIEGQLIRLGSGRDYKNKIEMIEEANNIRKLKDFDIDGVSKNAEGGRIGFSGGGIFRAIIANSAKKAGMTPYQYIKATSYKSLPQEVKMFMSKADFEKLKLGQEKMYSNYIDMAKTRQEFQKNIEGGKNTPARELFEGMEKTMDEQSYVPKTVTSDDIAQMELMVKNRFNKGRKDNAKGGLQTMLGE